MRDSNSHDESANHVGFRYLNPPIEPPAGFEPAHLSFEGSGSVQTELWRLVKSLWATSQKNKNLRF